MRLAVGVLFALLLPGLAAGADWRDWLKLPVSPGSVILLAGHSSEPAVVERWRQAVTHANPRIRAATARVINARAAAVR